MKLEDIKPAAPTEASITTALSPYEFVFNEHSIRGRIFSGKADKYGVDRYVETKNSSGDFMGYKFKHGHMTNKIYLPASKLRDPTLNSARVEVRFDKIDSLTNQSNIESWADLLRPESHYKLYQILLNSWDDTIVIDPLLRRSKKYPEWLNDMIHKGKKAEFWLNEFPQTGTDKTLKRRQMEYRKLSFEKGERLHTTIREAIKKEGAKLREKATRLTGRNPEINTNIYYIEDCINTNIMSKNNGELQIQYLDKSGNKKSKKQEIIEKRLVKHLQYSRFMNALKDTLQKIAA